MMSLHYVLVGCLMLLAVVLEFVQPTCVLESDFGFKINCAFKKSGLFRVRNLGGLKAHASLGFSLGDELGFEQSLTNMDPSRRRSVNIKNGAPNAVADASRTTGKQEKRGKQNRIMMRPMAPVNRPNQSAMDKLTSLHRRVSTMQPIIVGPTMQTPITVPRATPTVTKAKPMPMGVPPFRPLPPKEDTLQVLPLAPTRKSFTPLQLPQSKGPGIAYKSEHYTQDQFSKMVSQMTAAHNAQPQLLRITPSPIMVNTPKIFIPTTINPFVPMPVQAPPAQAAISIIPAPVFKNSIQIPLAPSMLSKTPTAYSLAQNTLSIQKTNPVSNFVDPVPYQVHDLASLYPVSTKKIDDYNTITGYGDDTTLKFNKEDINAKIVEIAKAGNISMEAVEAAIALRQQQLLNKYANLPLPTSTTTSTTTTTTTTTEVPLILQPEPEVVPSIPQVPKRNPTTGKVMNAPREYYPVGYEKNFDDHFQSKVDLPETVFHCGDQKYFPGLYGDESLGCMVFHVCALTDDGLVMKSFLCPESTLFDQTILKCNWWFYVDCKNTRRLYDTNIPVSKSYQLMKALTFFSSYRKEMQEDSKTPINPEEVTGIKEAITILENQDSKPAQSNSQPIGVQIITPQPIIDERNNHKIEISSESTPVYRGTRNYRNFTMSNTTKTNEEKSLKSENKLITLTTGLSFRDNNNIKNATNNSKIINGSAERKHRQRMSSRNNNTSTVKQSTTTKLSTTTTAKATITKLIEVTTPSVEIIKQEIEPIENLKIKQETLTDQLEDSSIINPIVSEASPVKRFYRSSAERYRIEKKERKQENKEMAIVNNEKVQIVRPTSMARLVGEFQTPTVTIEKLDEAVLGKPFNSRFKKSTISIVTPQNDYLNPNIKEQT